LRGAWQGYEKIEVSLDAIFFLVFITLLRLALLII